MAHKKGLKVGQTRIATRKINGKRRKVFIRKVGRKKYRIRVVDRKPRPPAKAKHYNVIGRGTGHGWTADMRRRSKEPWEVAYGKKKGVFGVL